MIELDRLDIHAGDVLVLRAIEDDGTMTDGLLAYLRDVGLEGQVLIVVLGADQDIRTLDVDEMRHYGWVRAEDKTE